MTIRAMIAVKNNHRNICIKDGEPMELAYSDDEGANWTVINCFNSNESIGNKDCLLSINDGQILFLATSMGRIYRSTDHAKTWLVIEDRVFFNTPYIMITQSVERIYAANESGLIFSDDYGNTWDIAHLPEWKDVLK